MLLHGYVVLSLTLVAGLFLYERYGLRLGGVMVLPLVVAYALFNPAVMPVFVGATLLTHSIGSHVQSRTLLYGRRLLYVYIVTGLWTSGLLFFLFHVSIDGIALAVLPGITAFNVHREGGAVRSMASFMGVAVPLYLVAHVLLMPFGFAGGIFPLVPAFHQTSIALLAFLPNLSPVGSAAAGSALDGTAIGALLASLLGGEAE